MCTYVWFWIVPCQSLINDPHERSWKCYYSGKSCRGYVFVWGVGHTGCKQWLEYLHCVHDSNIWFQCKVLLDRIPHILGSLCHIVPYQMLYLSGSKQKLLSKSHQSMYWQQLWTEIINVQMIAVSNTSTTYACIYDLDSCTGWWKRQIWCK